MKKTFLLGAANLLYCICIYGQNESLTIQDKYYPNPTINKVLDWTDDSLSEWKEYMRQFDFEKDRIGDEGQTLYTSGINLKNHDIVVQKFPSKRFEIVHTYYDDESLFDAFVEEAEPYYQKTNKGGLVEYGVATKSYLYRLIVMRTSSMEIISVERFNNNSK